MDRCIKFAIGAALFSVTALQPEPSLAFLSGGPAGSSGKSPNKLRRAEGRTKIDVDDLEPSSTLDETAETRSLNCEVINVGQSLDVQVGEEQLSVGQARAIALEATKSRTVPKSTVVQALRRLTQRVASEDLQQNGLAPADCVDGIWRLCFCEGDFLQGMNVDTHGYMTSGEHIDVRFDSEDSRIVLGSEGFRSLLPSIVHGSLVHEADTQMFAATFDKETTGIDRILLQTCLVDEDALGFRTLAQGKTGFLLFQAERSKRVAARLSKYAIGISSKTSEAKKAATAGVAGNKKLDLRMDLKLVRDEDVHEDRRLAHEETGRKTGSFNTFIRYLETEGGMIYAVLAGPVLYSFLRDYTPVASSKTIAALVVLEETFRQYFQVNT